MLLQAAEFRLERCPPGQLIHSTIMKGKLLNKALAQFTTMRNAIKDVMGRLQVRVAQILQRTDGSKLGSRIFIRSHNTLQLS